MTTQLKIARKSYKCQKCGREIKPGQPYYLKRQSGKVHNRMTYWNIEWHARTIDCLSLSPKSNRMEEK